MVLHRPVELARLLGISRRAKPTRFGIGLEIASARLRAARILLWFVEARRQGLIPLECYFVKGDGQGVPA